MNDDERQRAKRLHVLLSRNGGPGAREFDALAAEAPSYAMFRARLVMQGILGESSSFVLQRWRESIALKQETKDANDLTLEIERLESRVAELERRIAAQDGVIREKFVQIDGIAFRLAEVQTRSKSMIELITRYRTAILKINQREQEGV